MDQSTCEAGSTSTRSASPTSSIRGLSTQPYIICRYYIIIIDKMTSFFSGGGPSLLPVYSFPLISINFPSFKLLFVVLITCHNLLFGQCFTPKLFDIRFSNWFRVGVFSVVDPDPFQFRHPDPIRTYKKSSQKSEKNNTLQISDYFSP